MKLIDFENELQAIRAANGWKLEIEMPGIFIISVYDKESDVFLAETGCTSLEGILVVLRWGLDHGVWSKPEPPLPNIVRIANDAYAAFNGLKEPRDAQIGISVASDFKIARKWIIANPDKCRLSQAELIEAIDEKLTKVYGEYGIIYIRPEDVPSSMKK